MLLPLLLAVLRCLSMGSTFLVFRKQPIRNFQRNIAKILHFKPVHSMETQLPFALLKLLEVPLSLYMVMCGMSLEVKVLRRRLL